MEKQRVAKQSADAVASGGREGTGGGPEKSGAERTLVRNSSGERSSVSRLIDLELKMRMLTRAVASIAASLGDEQLVHDLKHGLGK